ncbi:MAG TPA: ATP-binding protein [Candidatus Rubrimentiphilum sp.]|nr:ATP-binding protein [Candidatus Rubrimentiphilum sp.]
MSAAPVSPKVYDGPLLDPFTAPLDQLTYESLCEAFRDVGSETQRLEFKREIDPEELARQAVAMANGSGGLVVVGFDDPMEGTPLKPFSFPDKIDEPARRRLLSKIQSRVYPSLSLEAAGYTASNGNEKALVLRVASSMSAPHEHLNDRGRFLIRRGTAIAGMSLRELETMIRRRDGSADVSIIQRPNWHPMLSFDRSVSDGFVGAMLFPETIAEDEPLSKSRQNEIERIVGHVNKLTDAIPIPYPEGVLFERQLRPVSDRAVVIDESRGVRWSRRAYVGADGRLELRETEVEGSYEESLISVLCNLYQMGSQILLALGLGPRARCSLICHRTVGGLGAERLAGDGEFPFNVDFSSDTVVRMARRPLMYALRTAGKVTDPEDVEPKITKHWQYVAGGDLRTNWH